MLSKMLQSRALFSEMRFRSVVKAATDLLGDSEASTYLRDAYRAGENMGTAFGKLFARVFDEWGVILLDASDEELHQIAAPLFAGRSSESAELDEKLLARGKQLEVGGVSPAGQGYDLVHFAVHVPQWSAHSGSAQGGQRQARNFVVGDEKILSC